MDTILKRREAYLLRKDDEEVVQLTQRHHGLWKKAAIRALWRRYHGRCEHLIKRIARQQHLSAGHMDDIKQELPFWIWRAIERYDPAHGGHQARFSTFLGCVVTSGVHDLIRQVRRRQRHEKGQSELADAVAAGTASPSASQEIESACATDDALDQVEWRDLREYMRAVVARWPENDRALWNDFCSGTSLEHIADQLGCTVRHVRRLRAALLTRLRQELNDEP